MVGEDAAPLEILSDVAGRTGTLRLAGEVDPHTERWLYDAGIELLDSGCQDLVIEASGVTFLDSSGLRALLQLNEAAKDRGGQLTMEHPTTIVHRLISVTGLDGVLAISA